MNIRNNVHCKKTGDRIGTKSGQNWDKHFLSQDNSGQKGTNLGQDKLGQKLGQITYPNFDK